MHTTLSITVSLNNITTSVKHSSLLPSHVAPLLLSTLAALLLSTQASSLLSPALGSLSVSMQWVCWWEPWLMSMQWVCW